MSEIDPLAGLDLDDPGIQAAIEEGKERTYEKAVEANPCTECFEPYLDRHHGWRLRIICNRLKGFKPDQCVHEHHDGEVWIG